VVPLLGKDSAAASPSSLFRSPLTMIADIDSSTIIIIIMILFADGDRL
jgi:hypothetical protein